MSRRLLLLVAAVAVPLSLLAIGTVWLDYRHDRAFAEGQQVEHARTLARLVDREFDRAEGVALALAASAALARGDLGAFDGELRAARDLLGASLPAAETPKIALFDADGVRRLYTAWAPGEWRAGPPGMPYIQAAIASGRTQNSDLIDVPAAGPPCAAVAVPVFAPAADGSGDRRVAGVIALTVARERLLEVTAAAGLPDGSSASVLDRRGTTVARSFRDAETLGKPPSPDVLAAVLGADAGLAPRGARTLEGVPSAIAFARAPRSGFVVELDVPESALLTPLRASLARAAAAGSAVLAFGLALAAWVSRRIVAAFHGVPGAVAAGASSSAAPHGGAGLREADDLTAALAAAVAERERATASVRALFENSPVGVVISDTGGRVHSANDAFLAMVGLPRAALDAGAVHWDEITPDEWLGRDEAAIAEAVGAGRCTPYEKEYLRPDGSRVPVLVSFSLTDRVVGLAAAFVVDLTERQAAEAKLRESEARLRLAQDAGGVGAWEADLATGVRFWTDATYRLWGLEPETDITVELLLGMVHEDDRARVRAAAERAKTLEGPLAELEFRIHRGGDGALRWINSRSEIAARDPSTGRPRRQIGVMRDVTASREVEAALRESEARLRTITEAMPQMVWSTRPDGANDYLNGRWYEATGTTPEQMRGEGWGSIVHPDDRERLWARWRHALATGEVYEAEHRLRMADGTWRWVLGRALPVRDPASGAVLRWFGTCTDIHDTVAAREALARSREELERLVEARTRSLEETQSRLAHARRIEALGQLAGGIAHDFNNVIQAVQGGAALIERRPGDPDGVRRLARMVSEAAGRGAAITRRLLAFSRRGDLRTETVDPVSLLTGLHEVLTHTLGTGVGVRVEAARGLPPLLADKGQLETVLINLATNARDAMAGNGLLTLAAAAEVLRRDGSPGQPVNLEAGAYVRLSVTDTGAGMPPEVLARVTEPFFTTKPQGEGTGLGLAMAKGFAEQSGGGLHIESAPGKGTTVRLWFPLAEGALPAVPPATEQTNPVGGRGRVRTLLVEDDAIVREVTAEGLEAEGYAVLVAADGPAALALLDEGEAVDVLISDLSMPGMDGIAVIREAQRRRPRLPAVLLTGFATDAAEIAIGGAMSGAFTLLRKPIEGRVLAERVAMLLEGAAAGEREPG